MAPVRHALVTANTALLLVVTLHFMKLLKHTHAAGAGLVGVALAIFGACMLAADKGALCLIMKQPQLRAPVSQYY